MKSTTPIKKINSTKTVGKLDFWKRIALEQQIIIHAKNRT